MYQIPEEYYFRIHHVRPRFKGDIENVLIYMATEISKIPQMSRTDFMNRVNAAIQLFPGNANKTIKTINNWRTEISALFGFIDYVGEECKPGLRAIELANNQDLVESFKIFLYNFQYPGGHIKPHETLKIIDAGIKFRPVQCILKVLQYAENETGKRVSITKAEATHCIFNDLRCTRDHEDASMTWNRINQNREENIDYDQSGDVIRYAGDILDYMEIADLLRCYNGKDYFVNRMETESILKFTSSTQWFDKYDHMYGGNADLIKISNLQDSWYAHVNQNIQGTDFQTDILAIIADSSDEYEKLKMASITLLNTKLENTGSLSTKDIGDIGESIIHSHECERIRKIGLENLLHLIKRIPTQYAVGYDIQSVESESQKRYIEVKTTVSSKPLNFNKIHLTPNEWNTADTLKDRYFIYRLMVNKQEKKLYIIQNPVGLYKSDEIQMIPRDGADITFNTETSGSYEELLSWIS